MLGRIEAERYDQCARRKSTDRLFRRTERLHVTVVPGADRQRNIEIGTKPGPGAALVGIAPNAAIALLLRKQKPLARSR